MSDLRGTTRRLSALRKIIAERMMGSLHTSAQLTTVVEADLSEVVVFRRHLAAQADSSAIRDLAATVRAGQVEKELTGGAFTLTNTGSRADAARYLNEVRAMLREPDRLLEADTASSLAVPGGVSA